MAKRIRGLGRLVVVSISPVRDADAARAVEYASLGGGIEHTAVSERETVLAWAEAVSGLIVDVGRGPGQCTGYLAGHHADIEGVDPVPEFIEIARTTYPGVAYWPGPAISASAM